MSLAACRSESATNADLEGKVVALQLVYLKEARLSHTPSGPHVVDLTPLFVNLGNVMCIKEVDLGDFELSELLFNDGYRIYVKETFADIYKLVTEGRKG